ncbi:hypothetical protein [Blastochloris tepida]|jgi:hypothetical protein|uniref:Uncharacterized protein n=1 Tax=Blastochloris tepida TaxID=2233851 RepID=A0A348FWY3_9HYPH|nr:hypothetical protein [Blastochloris tepida]BBF91816.1 hypothetical protein BLTE_05010 [Blastochloris tepida]
MMTRRDGDSGQAPQGVPAAGEAPRPTEAQRRYLMRGLGQAGGKLPLFDADGREVPHKTIEACIAHGWAERWIANPVKPDWLVCRLTAAGYRVLGAEPPAGAQT